MLSIATEPIMRGPITHKDVHKYKQTVFQIRKPVKKMKCYEHFKGLKRKLNSPKCVFFLVYLLKKARRTIEIAKCSISHQL